MDLRYSFLPEHPQAPEHPEQLPVQPEEVELPQVLAEGQPMHF